MDNWEKLLRLRRGNNANALQEYVRSLSAESICSELGGICSREDGVTALQALFAGLSTSPSCQDKRMKITRTVLQTIERNKAISNKLTEKLVSVLASQVESFSASNIIALLDTCLQMMREAKDADGCNCWKDFIPKLLNKIVEVDHLEHNGSRKTGTEYKGEVIVAICLHEWPDHVITSIASMFVDISLSSEEHLRVVNKLCKRIPDVDLRELPSLVNQVLELTAEKHFMPLFLSLRDLFDSKLYSKMSVKNGASQRTALKEMQAAESMVLYNMYTMVSLLGPQSVKDFLKTLKDCVHVPEFVLTPFAVTYLLTLSCFSTSFEEEILNVLKAAILRNLCEEERIFDSAWIETVVPAAAVVDDVFSKVIQNCFRERDKVLKGLVSLAFSLLATSKTRGRETQCERAWSLANSILVSLIKEYGDVTPSILQTLSDQISQVHESTQHADCLFHIVRKNPLSLLDCSSALLQLLENVCARLPGCVGKRAVAAILPLTKMSQSLRDNLIIFLRKSLFPHDRAGREMAVAGLLELLKDLKISNLRGLSQSISQNYCGLTQIYSQTHAGPGPSYTNEGICLELLSILREVFKHEQEVKIVFYTGVYESVYVNPEIGCHALDILQNQLDKFFVAGSDVPPLRFDKAVSRQGNSVVVQEPIAHLVLSVGLVVAGMGEESSRCDKLKEMFDSLSGRMAECDVPNFISGTESFDGGPESLAKEEEIRQILGVYEALIGYNLCSWRRDSTRSGDMLNSLFKAYSRLCDFARGLGKTEKKKAEEKGRKKATAEDGGEKRKEKGKNVAFKFPATVLNLKCACRLLSLLYETSVSWASDESTRTMKSKRELHRYCLNVLLTLIKQAQGLTATELSRATATTGYFAKIGRILFERCLKRLDEVTAFDLQTAVLGAECFAELATLAVSSFKKKLSNFLRDITGTGVENGVRVQLKELLDELLSQLQRILRDLSNEDDKEEGAQARKLSLLLVAASASLVGQLPRGGSQAQQVLDRIKEMCREAEVASPVVAKPLVTLLLTAYAKCKPSGSLAMDLALCLCDKMCLIDDEMKIDEHDKYAVVSESTANACLIALCDTVRGLVSEIEWIVARLKAELLVLSFPCNDSSDRREGLWERERELCRHINFAGKTLSLLCAVAVPPGFHANAVLKEIGNFYNKIALVAKYFILKVGKYRHSLESSRFDKTVKLVDGEVSRNMYGFTEHVICDGAGSDVAGAGRNSKRGGDPAFLKSKCLKETKIIPKLIYEKEQFQKFVLQLSNKSKINMSAHMKHTHARDYRLYSKQVKQILERKNVRTEDAEMDSTPLGEEGEGEESQEQSSKRPRLSQ